METQAMPPLHLQMTDNEVRAHKSCFAVLVVCHSTV